MCICYLQSVSNVLATAALCSSVRGVWADECLSWELTQCGLFARDEIRAQLGYYINAFQSAQQYLTLSTVTPTQQYLALNNIRPNRSTISGLSKSAQQYPGKRSTISNNAQQYPGVKSAQQYRIQTLKQYRAQQYLTLNNIRQNLYSKGLLRPRYRIRTRFLFEDRGRILLSVRILLSDSCGLILLSIGILLSVLADIVERFGGYC
jgi:hypothetical protein